MNVGALIAILVFFAALLGIFGGIYYSASKSEKRGELSVEGTRLLRIAFLGHVTIFILLMITAFLT
ncbi:MAG: hypothetical protein QXV32_04730 [Conexivisphaerales archaeon]